MMILRQFGTGLLIWLMTSAGCSAQTKIEQVNTVSDYFCLSQAEWDLAQLINAYRKQNSLAPVPLSKALCYVANTHVKDLFFNHPDEDPCNAHSWSDKGIWKPFCYPQDEDKKNSVWDKPTELTGYPGKGYEIIFWENNPVIIDSILSFWKSFDYFNSFLMNRGKWEGRTWKAFGVGIFENYAAAWFGEETDTLPAPYICGQKPAAAEPQQAEPTPPVTQKPPSASAADAPLQASPPGTFYVIIQSQLSLKDSEALVLQLQQKGYPQARTLTTGGKTRVSIYETVSRGEANQLLREVKKIYKDAWLLIP